MLQCGTTNKQLKIELLSRWKLEAEFRNTIYGGQIWLLNMISVAFDSFVLLMSGKEERVL